MAAESERYRRGAALLKEKRPDEYENLLKNFAPLEPDLANFVIEFAYGDIWTRPGLDLKQRALVTVSALAAIGAEVHLKSHIGGALACGCSQKELLEAFIQIIPYAGFPRALSAVRILREIMADKVKTT